MEHGIMANQIIPRGQQSGNTDVTGPVNAGHTTLELLLGLAVPDPLSRPVYPATLRALHGSLSEN